MPLALVFIFTSAAASQKIEKYLVEFFLATYLQALNPATIILAVWTLPNEILYKIKVSLDRLFGSSGSIATKKFTGSFDLSCQHQD
jgi:hypothetical protein